MGDLVERLRSWRGEWSAQRIDSTMCEAADRIEALEAALRNLYGIAVDEGIVGDKTTLEAARSALEGK